MSEIKNRLKVYGSNSIKETQSCTFDISSPAWIFSYKSCQVENDILRKGGDYAFTLTFGNMGECSGTTGIYDKISVSDIGGVQFKLMDLCGNLDGHSLYFYGLFYNPAKNSYKKGLRSLSQIMKYNLELVVCPDIPMYIFLYDHVRKTLFLKLEPHTMNCLGLLFQVENIFCGTCPALVKSADFNTLQVEEEELDMILTDDNLEESLQDIDVILSSLVEK